MKKWVLIVMAILLLPFVAGKAHAAQLQQFSDTITTSRPSASAPLNSDITGGANTFSAVILDNKSIFLASDSAQFLPDPNGGGETADTNINVASMSALNSTTRTIYFTNNIANNHHKGDAVIVPVTAMHAVQFKIQTTVPINGHIIITFPGGGNNTASPSASTFAFNGLTSSQIQAVGANCNYTITAPTIDCVEQSSAINPGTTVTFLIGCTSASGSACSAQSPRLINPTRNPNDLTGGAASTSNTADNWRITVSTEDTSNNILDQSSTTIGTIESVQVQASVDPTLTFTIAGIANNVTLNSGHGASCPADTTNSGFTSFGSSVNLGTLVQGQVNMSAQDLTVSTNQAAGYALTATASGTFQNPASGYSFVSNTTPTVLPTLPTEVFGIHPCGTDVNSSTWAPTSSGVTASAGKIAWPVNTSGSVTLTLASRNSIANLITTTVEYISTVTGTTPAGTYNSTITYVATPTFN